MESIQFQLFFIDTISGTSLNKIIYDYSFYKHFINTL